VTRTFVNLAGLALLVGVLASTAGAAVGWRVFATGKDSALISIVGLQPSLGGDSTVWVWTGTPSRLGAARFVAHADSPVLSPNGRLVAYESRGDLRVQPVASGAARTLTHVQGKTVSMAFSPSGARIAFISDGAIIQLPVVGKGPALRVPLPSLWRKSRFEFLQWSSEGFAFSRSSGGAHNYDRNELDFVRPDGTARVLYRNPTPKWTVVAPSFSRDGMHIAVTASHHGGLLSISTGAGVSTRLTARGQDEEAVWSPDGKWVAFDRWMSESGGVADVWVVRADGTGLRRLTTSPIPRPPDGSVSTPLAWSPDGKQLLIYHSYYRDRFAVLDIATGRSRDLKRVGDQHVIAAARWN
jgi:hypothetical protein